MDASVRALVEEFSATVSIFHEPPADNAPYAKGEFFQYACRETCIRPDEYASLQKEVEDTRPDILLVCSWHIPAYRHLAGRLPGRSVRVLCMDNQWLGTAKQYAGCLAAPLYLWPNYDVAFAAGKRQAEFARRLGFARARIVEGHYSCDTGRFAAQFEQRAQRPLSKSFMFVGRLVPEKGIDTLFAAWREFSARNTDWKLKVVGAGSVDRWGGLPANVELLGFVQPSALPAGFLQGDVFVLPSRFEPWGVVVHEAAATGMPIVCSDACGAGDAFVNGENGIVVPRNDPAALARAFATISTLTEDRIRAMGAQSLVLAKRRTPSTWARAVTDMAATTMAGAGR
jgi:glycosyltransferase involved in cell wall biosynthesis